MARKKESHRLRLKNLKGKGTLFFFLLLFSLVLGTWAVIYYFPKIKVLEKPPPSKEEIQLKFTKTDFPYQEVKTGESLQFGCSYENLSGQEGKVKKEIVFSPVKPLFSQPESQGQIFSVFSQDDQIKKGEEVLISEFRVPENLPSGEYQAVLEVYTLPSYKLKGGCRTEVFKVENKKSLVLNLGLVVPQAERSFLPALYNLNDRLVFSFYSQTDFRNLTSKLEILDPISQDVLFEKELERISFSKGEEKTYPVTISDFQKEGIFLLRLSFYNASGEKVSTTPREAVYFGFPPALGKAEIVKKTKKEFEIKIDYTKKFDAGGPFLLLVVVRNKKGQECGFLSFDLKDRWPERVSVVNREECEGEIQATVAISVKRLGSYLSVVKTEE